MTVGTAEDLRTGSRLRATSTSESEASASADESGPHASNEARGKTGEPPTPSDAEREAVSNHVRTLLLRRIAHDIASPAGVTQTVLDEIAADGCARPELVTMARRSLRRLMRLSEHLALVAELEAGPIDPDLVPTDVRTVTKHAVDAAIAIDGRKDIATECSLGDVAGPIDADPRLLGLAIREIVGNALRTTSSRVEVHVDVAGDVIEVRVDDDGPGFTPEAVAKLGTRFHATSTTRGLGLSLSMATEFLRLHGGGLRVETSALPPGRRGTRGAAVIVTLPRKTA